MRRLPSTVSYTGVQPPACVPAYCCLACLRRRLVEGRLGRLRGLLDVEVVDQVGHIVVVVVLCRSVRPLLALLERLVGLGELAEGREGVGTELVEDAGHELSELLQVPGAVDGEGVGGHGGVH